MNTTTTVPPDEAAVKATQGTTIVGQAKVPSLPVFSEPDAAEPSASLANPNADGAPVVVVVKSSRRIVTDRSGQRTGRLEVLLPGPPNGSRGWVKVDDVALSEHTFRIEVELTNRRITVKKGPENVLQEPVGLGEKDVPPPGEYFVTELLQPENPRGRYGPFVYGLSGYPEVKKKFAAGTGFVGIHGTNDASALGKTVSTGSIRMSNEAITRLSTMLPLGTPVVVMA